MVTVGRLSRVVAELLPPAARGALERPVTDYKAPGYWLDYRSGFVRRGLPGEVLRRVAGGSPTYRQMERTAVVLARASALSVVPMAAEAALRAPGGPPRAVTAGLILSSPLTCSLLLHDVGRYDAIGVLVLALLSTGRAAWLRLPLPVSTALLAGAVAGAVASEEFLLAVLTPAAIAAVGRLAHEHRASQAARRWLLGGVLGPGALLAGASLLVPAPGDAIAAARAEAARAGVGARGAMGDSLSAVDRGFVENLAFFRLFRPTAVGSSFGLWAGLYSVTAGVLGELLGEGAGRRYRQAATAHALVATALSASLLLVAAAVVQGVAIARSAPALRRHGSAYAILVALFVVSGFALQPVQPVAGFAFAAATAVLAVRLPRADGIPVARINPGERGNALA